MSRSQISIADARRQHVADRFPAAAEHCDPGIKLLHMPRAAMAVLGMRLQDARSPLDPMQAAAHLAVAPEAIDQAVDQLTRGGFLDRGQTPVHPDVVMAKLRGRANQANPNQGGAPDAAQPRAR